MYFNFHPFYIGKKNIYITEKKSANSKKKFSP